MKASIPLKCLAAAAAMLISLPSLAIGLDSASLEGGDGNRVGLLRLAVQSHWDQRWLASQGRHFGGYWDANVTQWRGSAYRGINGVHQNLTSIGLTPVIRYQADDLAGWYVEAGIGANLLSELYDNDHKKLSTAFQFGDHLGAGYVLRSGWDIGIKLQHFSNGGIKEPNNGVNFVMLKVARKF